ncbi:MAG TPA: LysM peptidoglycan-binding domain-containing protein [Anaerolineales bacterium]|nr:LysM peptidoglycan-binding domain-containing protein [Anaerolineales bacterium]
MDTGFSGLGGSLYGLLAAGLAVVLVAGGLVLSFTEGGIPLALLPSPTATPALPEQAATLFPLASQSLPTPFPTALASPTPTFTLSPLPSTTLSVTGAPPPTQAACPPPNGWKPITIARGDTLNKLAQDYGVSPEELIEANCLVKSQLEPGMTLYVPAKAPPTPVPCGPPAGWAYTYIVQPGDTLFSISKRAGVSVAQLKQANCLSSDSIRVGQKLSLPVPIEPPPAPTRTPTEIELPSQTSPPPTDTPEPPTPTEVIPERTPIPPAPTLDLPTPPGTP